MPFGDFCWYSDKFSDKGFDSLIWENEKWLPTSSFTDYEWESLPKRWTLFVRRQYQNVREGLQRLLSGGGLHVGERA